MFNKLKQYIPSIVTAIIGIAIFLIIPSQIDLSRISDSAKAGINSRTIPYFLSSLIILLSVIDILMRLKKTQKIESVEQQPINKSAIFRVFIMILAIFIWIKILPIIGFTIGMILLLVFGMILMGNRKWYLIIIIPIVTSVLLNYVFSEFVGRTLPAGIFF
jgi:hypothetical protein